MGTHVSVILAESLTSVQRCSASIETAGAEQWHDLKVSVGACEGESLRSH